MVARERPGRYKAIWAHIPQEWSIESEILRRNVRSVPDAILRHGEHGLRLGKVRRVHEPRNPLSSLALPEVQAERCAVPHGVSSHGPVLLPEERIRLRVDLI